MENPIRILYIVPSLTLCNGVASYAMNYFNNIDKDKIQIDFITGENEENIYYNEIKRAGSEIFYIPKMGLKNIFKTIKKIKNFFKENAHRYDIIHCHVLNMGAFYSYYAKKYGIKVRILHSHATKSADKKIKEIRNNILAPIALKNANVYCACSNLAGKNMFGEEKYKIINNAINIDKFKYNSEKRNYIRNLEKIDNDEFIVGNIGRFMPQKNQLFLIDIFYEYLKMNPKSKLLMIGSGYLKDKIIEKIKEYKIEKSIIIKENITNVNEYLQAMDVFILPSLYEGLPVVGIEAQSAGLPCLFADTITKETQLIENCKFLSLSNINDWVEELNNMKNIKRKDVSQMIKDNNYDIKTEAKKLESYYKKLFEEKDKI